MTAHTLFIADLHLDPRRPAITRLFLSFLQTRARQADALYILGDLFEAWIGDDAPEPDYAQVREALYAATRSGLPVYLMHGNRDFLLGDAFCQHSGTTLLPDPTVIDLYGTLTLVSHGDHLCTDDTEYQAFRSMVRNPAWQQAFLAKPVAERQAIARQLRETSQERNQQKAEAIMDVNPDAVDTALRSAGVSRLIHGHTHRPAIHDWQLDNTAAQRMVVGDWYEQGSVLRCDKDSCQLQTLDLEHQGNPD